MKNASPEKKIIFLGEKKEKKSGKALHRGLPFSSHTPDGAFVAVECACSLQTSVHSPQTSGRSPQTSGCVLTAPMARGVAVCGAVMRSSSGHPLSGISLRLNLKPKYNLLFVLSVLPCGKLFSKPPPPESSGSLPSKTQ